ncbi:MAG: hypothetical protein JO193_09280 [Candidatus Eremiobacteraeota bacterium]|nr:hypothetical protein [Candidatus Eremiobacteraeota bacterium]
MSRSRFRPRHLKIALRFFFSTGEPSGELSAIHLATEIAARDSSASFEGIGAEQMERFGFKLWATNRGWASITPVSGIAKAPHLYRTKETTAQRLIADPPDRIVLVDFGAFNVRLAGALRKANYGGRIIYYFAPGAWLDNAKQARAVARMTVPISAFLHQYEFYKGLGLEVHYFGHPLASRYELRPPPSVASPSGGSVALLPGSRAAELEHHIPLLLDALERLRTQRPDVIAYAVAATDVAEKILRDAIANRTARVEVVRGTEAALKTVDASWIASGTAVLEAALLGAPCVVFYHMTPLQARIARYLYRGRFVALSNLIAGREIVPEFVQEKARPELLAAAMDAVLKNPLAQYNALRELRPKIGDRDALPRIADFVLAQQT